MTKKIGDKKIGRVQSTQETADVEKTGGVGGVSGVAPTSSVGGVSGTGAVGKRRGTRVMSMAERQQLLDMIDEEADKLFAEGSPFAKKKEMLKNAVKMVVDSGIIDEDEEPKK